MQILISPQILHGVKGYVVKVNGEAVYFTTQEENAQKELAKILKKAIDTHHPPRC
ncbi:hypothetical protein SAMN05444392_102251 [Seinonella peptonophila]|uniref:Uncharacterized protein n=1 Tax=Seinonella peptonophila TaxID=112248 RepID=A0A1M4V9K4_9BACL|nr:hypothetical protein [Seinonella peptonophila]SHE65686.1 hypothetical protein SAMN05444392_102251 [Seinonella peptonophila]